jgi:hypothetical protein
MYDNREEEEIKHGHSIMSTASNLIKYIINIEWDSLKTPNYKYIGEEDGFVETCNILLNVPPFSRGSLSDLHTYMPSGDSSAH